MRTQEAQHYIQEARSSGRVTDIATVALGGALGAEHKQAGLFAQIERGPDLTIPTNFLKGTDLTVPSLEVVSPFKHNRASIVDIHGTDRTLSDLYDETVRAGKGVRDRVTGMFFETVVRILDTNGAQGLHHVHDTVFPFTLFQVVKKGSGVTPNVYVTRLGEREEGVPVFGLVTATRDKPAEYRLFHAIGAGSQKRKHTA